MRFRSKTYRLRKGLSGLLVTFLVVSMLLIPGPASAVTLGIEGLNDISEEQIETFSVTMDIEEGELVPVDEFNLSIGERSCLFSVDGNEISGNLCGFVTIMRTSAIDENSGTNLYGYGFSFDPSTGSYRFMNHTFADGLGYGYSASALEGELRYQIRFDPWDVAQDETEQVLFFAHAEDAIFRIEQSDDITIRAVDPDDDDDHHSSSGGREYASDNSVRFPEYQTINSYEDLVQISEDLGVDVSDIESIAWVDRGEVRIVTDLSDPGVPREARSALAEMQRRVDSGQYEEASVIRSIENYRVYLRDGSFDTYSRISYSMEGLEGNVGLLEIIPKSVALDVSELTFSTAPIVIERDPIVFWNIDSSRDQDVYYTVKGEIYSLDSETYAIAEYTLDVGSAFNSDPTYAASGESGKVYYSHKEKEMMILLGVIVFLLLLILLELIWIVGRRKRSVRRAKKGTHRSHNYVREHEHGHSEH